MRGMARGYAAGGLSRTGVARDCGDVGSVAGWPSGREWNGLQPGQGATELGFPRPATLTAEESLQQFALCDRLVAIRPR